MHDRKNDKFWGIVKVKWNTPLYHTAPTTEIEHPFRVCPKSKIIRLSFGRAMILGKWQTGADEHSEEYASHLLSAILGREIETEQGASFRSAGEAAGAG